MINKYLIEKILFVLLLNISVANSQWMSAANMHMPRGGAAAVKWGNYIYVFGGKAMNNKALDSVERFDLRTGEWDKKTVPDFDKARYNARAIVFDDKIYLIGGRDESSALKKVEVYDPVQNSWSEAQNLHEEREGLAVHILNGLMHVIGGREEYHSIVSDIEWYNKSENKWKVGSWEMKYPRADFFSAAYRDTFYQFGGYYYGLTKTAYRAVPTNEGYRWESLGELSTGRAYGVSLVIDDQIFLIGGEVADGKSDMVEVYNIHEGSFHEFTPLSGARSGMAGVVSGDTLFVIGGFAGNDDTPMHTVEYTTLAATPIGIIDRSPVPRTKILVKGYPNPFNGRITFRIRISDSDQYRLEIFDLAGRLIKTLYNGRLTAGEQQFSWDARDNNRQMSASGVYFLVVRSTKEAQRLKIIYVR